MSKSKEDKIFFVVTKRPITASIPSWLDEYIYTDCTEEEANKKAAELMARGGRDVFIGKLISKVVLAPVKVVPL